MQGQSGVEKMLQILKEEVFKAFALSGRCVHVYVAQSLVGLEI